MRILQEKKVLTGLRIKEKAGSIVRTEINGRKEEMISGNKSVPALLAILILSIVSPSCNNNNSAFNEIIPEEGWSRYHIPGFEAQINDSEGSYNIDISLRNSYKYPYRNIFLFVSTTAPGGQTIKDTLEFQLADEKGNWHGRGLGDIKSLTLPYKSNVMFPDTGIYSFSIEQGMRRDVLEGIIDVGLIISKIN